MLVVNMFETTEHLTRNIEDLFLRELVAVQLEPCSETARLAVLHLNVQVRVFDPCSIIAHDVGVRAERRQSKSLVERVKISHGAKALLDGVDGAVDLVLGHHDATV